MIHEVICRHVKRTLAACRVMLGDNRIATTDSSDDTGGKCRMNNHLRRPPTFSVNDVDSHTESMTPPNLLALAMIVACKCLNDRQLADRHYTSSHGPQAWPTICDLVAGNMP